MKNEKFIQENASTEPNKTSTGQLIFWNKLKKEDNKSVWYNKEIGTSI